MYADGDTGVVPRSNMFPLVHRKIHCMRCAIMLSFFFFLSVCSLFLQDYLELDIPVMIMANRQSSQSKSSG
jgi:hypothetical protein